MTPEPSPVVDLTCELVAVDSVSPSLAPGHAGERAIAELLAERLRRAGYDVELVEAPDDPRRVSVVAVHAGEGNAGHGSGGNGGGRPGRSVVLNGHLDTVGVEGMPHPFLPRVEDGRLLGRGASDMKGGVAGLVVAAEELARRGHAGTVIVALVADEEDASVGALAVIDRLRARGLTADACLIAEPTWLSLAASHRGYALHRVVLTGRAAHSSQPEQGIDVMTPLARLLTRVAEHDGRLRDGRAHPTGLRGSLMATVAHAGTAPFTVAARAEVSVERRTVPGEDAGTGLRELEGMLADVRAEFPHVGAEAELIVARDAWQLPADGPAAELSALLADGLAASGYAPPPLAAPYWMESALWQAAGVPTIVCGPAGGGLHAIDEWVDVDQLTVFPRVVAAAVERFLRD
ncbi:M20/M25/M40 family metallo-hydrolase [Microbacterium sp. No. 7]|uniref:M20/M25/M40 family metallo-hydrolase n=1 Tax=Microbacterium sp. No. 7 TaxID=1714373 RepID=UPI0006D01440|nr:M20/M25/M40 family metallo-hydrolase [Microbacterium sp. No. 7]ALJ19426.1 hypothetical protein AOA12_05695 [Microbacterium sp. No. 7]